MRGTTWRDLKMLVGRFAKNECCIIADGLLKVREDTAMSYDCVRGVEDSLDRLQILATYNGRRINLRHHIVIDTAFSFSPPRYAVLKVTRLPNVSHPKAVSQLDHVGKPTVQTCLSTVEHNLQLPLPPSGPRLRYHHECRLLAHPPTAIQCAPQSGAIRDCVQGHGIGSRAVWDRSWRWPGKAAQRDYLAGYGVERSLISPSS